MMDPALGGEALLTGFVIVGVIGLLAFTRIAADVVLMAGLTILLVFGVLTPQESLEGFANPGLATVAVLYVVVAGLRETGAVDWISTSLLGRPDSFFSALARLVFPVGIMSAFVNNTPVVAMMVPAVRDWARRTGLTASQLLMPLSYAAIIGGTCTIIGTSTNLVIDGMLIDRMGEGFGFFQLAWVGVPASIAVATYLFAFSRTLLPSHRDDEIDLEELKQYLVEMLVEPGSSLVGKTIEGAGLRHLPGLYLMDIERSGTSIPAVSPDEILQENDRLIFSGMVDSVADLQRFDGLRLASDQVFKLDTQRANHSLVEVVVSEACPLIGKTVRAGQFRNVYNAAIIAVSRSGEHVRARIGDIVLQAGDMLLLEANVDFPRQHRNSKDFMLVSSVENSQPYKTEKRGIAIGIFVAMVIVAALEITSLLVAGMVAAGLMMLTRCMSSANARREVSWQVLIVIGASIGLGRALFESGAAEVISRLLVTSVTADPILMLAMVFFVTALLTGVITNIAAATLMFPVVVSVSELTGTSLTAMVATLMVAASASFATPIGYQTNLMVMGPGGYHFSDFVRFGVPLTVIVGVVTVFCAHAFF